MEIFGRLIKGAGSVLPVFSMGNVLKYIFKKTKWVHKYLGIFLLVFIIWMSVSGILLNHPRLIADIKVPSMLTPERYKVNNWNRASAKDYIILSGSPYTGFIYGNYGIWVTYDGGNRFADFNSGLESYYSKRINDLLVINNDSLLVIATDNGIYKRNLSDSGWTGSGKGLPDKRVVKLMALNDSLYIFTDSEVFTADKKLSEFHKKILIRNEASKKIELTKLFSDLHNGSVWALSGRLFFDFAGIVLIWLSISSLIMWLYPWRRRKTGGKNYNYSSQARLIFKYSYKYHLLAGIWMGVVLMIFAVTGFFLRPPFLAVIADSKIEAKWYPGHLSANVWEKSIKNVLFNNRDKSIIIETTDGFWKGDSGFVSPFEPVESPLPVFVMGTTVWEMASEDTMIIGSFNGLFSKSLPEGNIMDVITGEINPKISPVSTGKFMITGFFKDNQNNEYVTTMEQGLISLSEKNELPLFKMPEELKNRPTMSLKTFLFELHNGRIFKGWLGNFYLTIIPLGSLLYLLILFTGAFDWFYVKIVAKKLRGNNEK